MLLDELRSRGFALRLDGEMVRVSPASALTAGLAQRIKDEKAELVLALLEQEYPGCPNDTEPEPVAPCACGANDWAYWPDGWRCCACRGRRR